MSGYRGLGLLASLAALLGMMDGWPAAKPVGIDGEEKEDYELHEEYEKIQRKESRLSRSERNRVVYLVERRARQPLSGLHPQRRCQSATGRAAREQGSFDFRKYHLLS
jgi:hypothetical protein